MKDHAETETEDPDLEELPPQREQEKEKNREGLILSSRFIRMLNIFCSRVFHGHAQFALISHLSKMRRTN